MPADRRRIRETLLLLPVGAILAVGLYTGPLRSAEWSWRTVVGAELPALAELEPVRALPRIGIGLAIVEAEQHLAAGRPYAAWERLREHLDQELPLGSAANLLAARAAAQWGGWAEVRSALEGRSWLEQVRGGEGVLLLARAEEELGRLDLASEHYAAYAELAGATEVGVAHSRRGRILSRRGDHVGAAVAFAEAAQALPVIADWLTVHELEERVAAGEGGVSGAAARAQGGSAPVRARRALLEAQEWITGAESGRAIRRLDWEARVLRAEGAFQEAAELLLARARLLRSSPIPEEAREEFRRIAADPAFPAAMRLQAAEELLAEPGRSEAEEWALAAAFEAAGRPGLAARSLRTALEERGESSAEEQLRLGRLLYEERDFPRARAAFQGAAPLLEERDARAEAELMAARALYRAGGSSAAQRSQRERAIAELRRIASDHPGSAAAGTALFLLGDEAATTEAGLRYYRQAAAIPASPESREALARVGDRSLRLKDRAGAIAAWEEFAARYPQGEETARLAYETGKLLDAAGRRSDARQMFEAAMRADPVSYPAMRAAEQLGTNPIDHVLSEPNPWIGLASEPAEAAALLERIDRLRAAGLEEDAEEEYQAALRTFNTRPYALLILAEGMRDRNRPVEAIRLGRQLLQQRQGQWDERLLRVVFPFPYRELIDAEARQAGIDPLLYAGLIRQESSFRADARSWVGATGLGQIMPATGRWLAPSVGIRNYDDSLLLIPELNVRMGTRYFGDLMRRYGNAADLALAGYNAGPGRADRWRREFNYGRDTDAFRSAIPFEETRSYVMIVLRNAAVYQRLYGGPGGSQFAAGQ